MGDLIKINNNNNNNIEKSGVPNYVLYSILDTQL